MEQPTPGLWDYIEKWAEVFTEPRKVWWNKFWIENDYCLDCKFCCGPQDSSIPFPMPLLPQQTNADTPHNFHMLDAYTPYIGKAGCKSDTCAGCRLSPQEKPPACGLFPIVLVNGSLWLYQQCPAVIFSPLIEFMKLARTAADWLRGFALDELCHLSLWLNNSTLARSYIDMHIRIFNPD